MRAKSIEGNHIPIRSHSVFCRRPEFDQDIGAVVVIMGITEKDREILFEVTEFRDFLSRITARSESYCFPLRVAQEVGKYDRGCCSSRTQEKLPATKARTALALLHSLNLLSWRS